MAAKLPKLQLPKDEAAQRQLSEASEVARSGELKSAQQMLKEGVASGLFPAPLQRQVLAWWSAGEYDLLSSEAKEKPKAVAKVNNMEEQVVKLMRENKWSRKEAVKYIDEGGLDMDAMRVPPESSKRRGAQRSPDRLLKPRTGKDKIEELDPFGSHQRAVRGRDERSHGRYVRQAEEKWTSAVVR
ncbi:unnamed protein product [Effrenium voratum]|nr:unnamed protein product [Effrenium voratum]